MINQIKKIAAKNKIFERIIYIAYKFCTFFYSVLFLLCRIFPIKDNKIVCCNMKGKRYGDNPKYILDEIIRQGLDYEMIWLMKDKDDKDIPKEIKRASYNPFSLAYHLSTAKVWIDSNLKAMGTLKREGQYFIQTWHGSYGLKKIAFDVNNECNLFDTEPYIYNAKIEDAMLSNSQRTTEIYRSAFRYNGEVLECGSPRNDIFFEDPDPYRKKINKAFPIIKGKRVVLYAPTYRADFKTDCMRINFEELISALSIKFGGEWVALVRLHPQNIEDAATFMHYSDKVINASNYNVMQELLVASDVLISDYSSCMFDFVTNGKPCFIYATDIEKYKTERDFYFDIMDLPFPVAQNMDEMIKNINGFNEIEYKTNLKQLFSQVGLCDNGTACKQVVDYIKTLSK